MLLSLHLHFPILCLDLIHILPPQLEDEPLVVSDPALCWYPLTILLSVWTEWYSENARLISLILDKVTKVNIVKLNMVTLTVIELNYINKILYHSLHSKASLIYSKALVNSYFPSDSSISPLSNSLCSLNFCFSFSNTFVISWYYTLDI